MNVMPSVVRTGVPLVVGVGVSFAAAKGIHISPETEAQVVVLIGAVAASAYHWVVRVLEEHWPRFGWMLGMARSPDYHRHDWDADYESTTRYDDDGNVTEISTVYRPRSGDDGSIKKDDHLY